MTEMIDPNQPAFTLAEGFVLPIFTDNDHMMPLVNQVLGSTKQYASVPLLDSAARRRVFTEHNPKHGFDCRGFALHALVPQAKNRVNIRTYVAPPPEVSETAFLHSCLDLNRRALPPPSFFGRSLERIATVLDHTDIPIATGVHVSVDPREPSLAFTSLLVPRMYVRKFGAEQGQDAPEVYATKLAAALFLRLTTHYLQKPQT